LLKGAEYDPANPEPYRLLSNLYNNQKKFDEATKAGAKANELMAASGGGGATHVDAEPGHHFLERRQVPGSQGAVRAGREGGPEKSLTRSTGSASRPTTSRRRVREISRTPRARCPSTLKLAPKGEYAEVAKALLATIK
jgi:hypothetical protein